MRYLRKLTPQFAVKKALQHALAVFAFTAAISTNSFAVLVQLGTSTSNNQTNMISPFSTQNVSQRWQTVIRASELTNAGGGPGSITSIAFYITTIQTPTPTSVNIRIGHTTDATQPSSMVSTSSGYTLVYSGNPSGFSSGANQWKTINFSTPFNWDGTSNIRIEICRGPTSGGNMINYGVALLNTGFNSTFSVGATSGSGCGLTSTAISTQSQNMVYRPVLQFNINLLPPCTSPPVPGNTIASANDVCSGTQLTLSLSGNLVGTGLSYQWQSNVDNSFGSPTNLGTSPTQSITASSTLYYRCLVTCSGTTVGSDPVLLNIANLNPQITSDAPGNSICRGVPVTLTVSGPGPYSWSTGETTQSIIVSPLNTESYSVTVGTGICAVQTSIDITVTNGPLANASSISPVCPGVTLQLNSNLNPGVANLTTANGNAITINSSGNANPYPSNINVAGLTGFPQAVKSVTINSIQHNNANQVDMVLQSPSGQRLILMADVGGTTAFDAAKTLTIMDGAPAMTGGTFASGTYSPTNLGDWSGSAAQDENISNLSDFTGANGTWSLYVFDDQSLTGGSIASWSITFEGQPFPYNTNGPVTYSWNGSNGFSSNDVNPVDYPNTTTTYTLTVSDNTCSSSSQVTVNVHPGVFPSSSNNGPFCSNGLLNLSAFGGVDYQWSGPYGFESTDQFPSVDPAQFGVNDGTYSVVVSNQYGCSATSTTEVEIHPNPELFTQSITPVACLGQNNGAFSVRVTPGTGSPGFTYFGSPGITPNGSGNFSNRTAGTYNMFVSDVNACVSETPWVVVVPTVPNEPPSFTSVPSDITMNNSPGVCGAPVTYALPVATDACPGLGSVVRIAGFASGSTFPVGTTVNTFMVTDAQGATATCSFSVTINDSEAPSITNVPANKSACNPISWTPPTITDNCPGVQVSSNHQPGETFPSGTTQIVYTATDVYGHVTTASFSVTVLEPSVAANNITSDRDYNNICRGESITLTLSGGSLGEGASWKWYAGGCGGSSIGTGTSITVSPNNTTTYNVRAEGTCNTTACVQITVVVSTTGPTGNLTYIHLPAYGAPGINDYIEVAPVTGAAFYRWFTNNGHANSVLFNNAVGPVETTAPTVNISFVLPEQNYQIRVLAGNACGRTAQANIHIRGTVDAPTSLTGPTVVCPGETHLYTVSAIPPVSGNTPVTYNWVLNPSNAGTISGTGLSRSVTFNAGFTSAQLCVNGISSFGLAGPAYCIQISSNAPMPGAVAGKALPCAGSTENYSIAALPGAISYNWSCSVLGATIVVNGIGLDANITFPAGSFSGNVCVTAVSACGESVPSCKAVTSGAPGTPGPIMGPVQGICNTNGVNYAVNAPGATGYDWQLSSGMTLASANNMSSVNINFATGYTPDLTVVVSYDCGTNNSSIAIHGEPAAPTVTPSTICPGTSQLYFATNATSVSTYNWNVTGNDPGEDPPYCTNLPTCSQYYVSWSAGGGTLSVTATNACGTSLPTSINTNCRVIDGFEMGTKVYPNPTEGRITVEFTSRQGGTHRLTVTDLAGREMLTRQVETHQGVNNQVMDLDFATRGLYLLYVKAPDGKVSVTRVAVE